MGSGVWFKNIISKKKVKADASQKLKTYSAPNNINGYKEELCLDKECPVLANGASVNNRGSVGLSIEDAAAAQIQTAYRAYVARKVFRRIRGMVRIQNLVQRDTVKKQASTALGHLHSWTRTQAQIRARRANMVTEGRLRQEEVENQLKLEAKLHDLEVEWNGGSETKGQALGKIHQRAEAAVRRERAMAYAFSHQWRANSSPSFGSSNRELSKVDWGWSWMDRWNAARPWESRVAPPDSPKKARILPQPKKAVKNTVSPTSRVPDNKVELTSPNGKPSRRACKLSYDAPVKKVNSKGEERKIKNAKEGS